MEARKSLGREEAIAALVLVRGRPLSKSECALFREVYQELFGAHEDAVWKVLVRGGAQEADQENLMSRILETFFFKTKAEGFPDSIRAKLLSMAAGMVLNLRRQRKNEPLILGIPSSRPEVPGSASDLAAKLDASENATRLFLTLSTEERALFWDLAVRGLTHDEAAAERNMPRVTLTKRYKAILTKLAKLAEKFMTDSERKPR